jgi:hypothetical protein
MTRRNFLGMALSAPVGAALARYSAMAAPAEGLSKVTKIQALQLAKGSALDIPLGYGSQKSGARSQDRSRVGVQ